MVNLLLFICNCMAIASPKERDDTRPSQPQSDVRILRKT